MESSLGLFVLIATSAITHVVQSQDQQGFYSLDCGLPGNEPSPYTEDFTGLLFSSDETYIQSGKSGRIKENPEGYSRPYETLRYFPDGKRNCYNLIVEKGRRYLIKASFVYGNYDGTNITPMFDLYLGPNHWAEIDLRQVNGIREEILHVPTSNSLQFCLVKTGKTTPLISTLELRPMGNNTYVTESGSLKHFFRRYLSKSGSNLRYSKDVYDRTWDPFFKKEWTQIPTALNVGNTNDYHPAEDAVKNAATPTDTSAPLTIEWTSTNSDDQYYYYAHFAEIEDLQANETRELKVLWNGIQYYGPFTPERRLLTVFSTKPQSSCDGGRCSFQVIRTNQSTLPPLLNALEVYKVIQFPQSETDQNDVVAMKDITVTYRLSRIDWQGDPCLPQQLRWDALICRDTAMFIPPRITSLNLSSSGLTGTIASAIQDLTQLEILDLSNNNLAGGVPEFLGNMKSLSVINLSGNNLNGSLPQALQRKGLKLSVEGNPRLCLSDSCIKPPTRKFPVAIVALVTSLATAIAVVILFLVLRKKSSNILEGLNQPHRNPSMNGTFANKNSRRFTYSEVIQMTNNFRRVLGKGGFGEVYHGYVNDFEEIAVKVISHSSTQGYKEFKAEVDLLLRVHHANLVSLVGYCYEGDHLALIYEFLHNGDLKQHLSGKRGKPFINWSMRLQIAMEAALGLEYLHIGCTPPMVHRDIKTSNILLDSNFKAKLADFGLSRSFQGGGKQESTVIAGTLGYLDPEYNHSGRLSEKSDVYSFGIVLLEIITNQPVINQTSKKSHITEWVGFEINRGDITEIMDPNLFKDYDSNSAWRALELAMSCADPSSSKRPSMSQVIQELKECIVCESVRVNNNKGLESQALNICLDSSVVPMAR